MRLALLAFSIVLASQTARAITAYEALRVLGKQKSETLLDNVTEVRGEHGAPQPHVWKIIVKDAAARGGAKEFSVQGSKLAGEQAARAGGAPMNMGQLNLDSDGAHTVAEREAKKVAFAYDHVSYTLRAGSKGGSPVWEIRLADEQSGETASLNIAATTGNVLSTDGLVNHRKPVVVVTPVPIPVPAPAPAPAPRYQPEPGERPAQPAPGGLSPGIQRANDEANKFFDRVENHMARRGRQISDAFHNLFTGDHRDTAGPHHSSRPEPTPPPSRAGDEDYVRPSRVRD
jgi:hypothetical protein